MLNLAKQDDWLKETQKKCPQKSDLSYCEDATLSLTLSLWTYLCAYSCTLFLLIRHFTCFASFCVYVEIHFCTADGPGPCHWPLVPGGLVARTQHSLSRPDFNLWPEAEILLQASAGPGHLRSCSFYIKANLVPLIPGERKSQLFQLIIALILLPWQL